MGWVIIGFGLIFLLDLVPVIRAKSVKNVVAFLLFFVPALVIMILWTNKIDIPSILIGLGDVMTALGITY